MLWVFGDGDVRLGVWIYVSLCALKKLCVCSMCGTTYLSEIEIESILNKVKNVIKIIQKSMNSIKM